MPVTCGQCTRASDREVDGDPPLGWTCERVTADGPTRWICVDCTRRFVRSMEAKLDHDWW